jgi:hypothetical protein
MSSDLSKVFSEQQLIEQSDREIYSLKGKSLGLALSDRKKR